LLEDGVRPWESEHFWADPDVRWLTGVNEADGETFFNKECFGELLSWLQLPALLDLPAEPRGLLADVEKQVMAVRESAAKAGYRLEPFLRSFAVEKPENDK